MGTLVTTPRRTWTTDFPGERLALREARLLDEQDAHEGPATDADVARYADFFVRVLGSVYKNTRFAQTIRCRGKVCAVFCFGEAPSVSEAQIRAPCRRSDGVARTYGGVFFEVCRRAASGHVVPGGISRREFFRCFFDRPKKPRPAPVPTRKPKAAPKPDPHAARARVQGKRAVTAPEVYVVRRRA